MMKRATIWRLAKSLVFCLVLLAMLVALDFVMTPSRGTTDPWPAVEATRNQVDVLALGSSRTHCAIMPMEMWRSAGVTVLDVTGPVQPFSVTTAYLKDAFQFQRPKVVMLDLYMCGKQTPFDMTRVHLNLDALPGGALRTQTILKSVEATGWFEALVPLQLYHNRWAELTVRDFQLTKHSRYAYARGAKYVAGGVPIQTTPLYEDIDPAAYARDLEYVRQMAKMCADHGATLILFDTPGPWLGRVDGKPLLARLEADLARQFPTVRYLDTDPIATSLGIDPKTDYKDVLHLNQTGAVKLSRWLAGYLRLAYGVADHRRDAFAASWNKSLPQYDSEFKKSD